MNEQLYRLKPITWGKVKSLLLSDRWEPSSQKHWYIAQVTAGSDYGVYRKDLYYNFGEFDRLEDAIRKANELITAELLESFEPVVPQAVWQPAETAPIDGTPVLVFYPDDGTEGDVVSEGVFDWCKSGCESPFSELQRLQGCYVPQPTHWMPSPPPPPQEEPEGERE